MTAEQLVKHTFAWEIAPGIPRDDLTGPSPDPDHRPAVGHGGP